MSVAIKKADMALMGKIKPLKETAVLVILQGVSRPYFARYSPTGHYAIEGRIGLTPVSEKDLWVDISDLIP